MALRWGGFAQEAVEFLALYWLSNRSEGVPSDEVQSWAARSFQPDDPIQWLLPSWNRYEAIEVSQES